MDYVNLGNTGLKVSRICLGCMSFGAPAATPRPGRHVWTLGEAESQPFLRQALDLGINFFDTANVYSSGDSENILGRFLKANARREAVVIATKVHGVMRDEPNGSGLSRKAIFFELDESLRRLQTDYVGLYQTHRWDYETPIEETLEALHDVVKSGKVRYIGASSMHAWQFTKTLYLADLHGWTRFVSMQNHYNLLYREEEREMIPLCQSEGIGIIPWSPLARGRLARPWQTENTRRFETDQFGKSLYSPSEGIDKAIVDRVGRSPNSGAFRALRWRWPGCSASRPSLRPSWERPSRTTLPMQQPRSPCALHLKRSRLSKSPIFRTPSLGFNKARSRLALKQEDQFDDQNNDHTHFQDEAPGSVEPIHHGLVEVTRRAQLLVNQVSVVRYANFASRQAVEASVEHITRKLDRRVNAFRQLRNLQAEGVQAFCLSRQLPTR